MKRSKRGNNAGGGRRQPGHALRRHPPPGGGTGGQVAFARAAELQQMQNPMQTPMWMTQGGLQTQYQPGMPVSAPVAATGLVNSGAMPMPPLDVSALPPEERTAAFEYNAFLNDLTFNSKDMINKLTRIAGENLMSHNAIAHVIEQRIFVAPAHAKLPVLYLLDSISKNIGLQYIHRFRRVVFRCFVCVYDSGNAQVRGSLHRLLNTWPQIFGSDVTDMIRNHVNMTDTSGAPHMRGALQVPHSADVPRSSSLAGNMQQGVSAPLSHGVHGMHGGQGAGQNPYAAVLSSMSSAVQVTRIEQMVAEMNRRVASGTLVSPLELNTVSTMINGQLLSTSLTPNERSKLHALQAQIRSISLGMPPLAQGLGGMSMPVAPGSSVGVVQPRPPPLRSGPLPVPRSHPPVSLPVMSGAIPSHLHSLVPPPQIPQSGNVVAVPQDSTGLPVAPGMSAPLLQSGMLNTAFIPPIPVIPFSQLKTLSHADVVRSLYTELPFLSKSDGMRFRSQSELRSHLDWLFAHNKRKRARQRPTAGSCASRCWYDSMSVFLGEPASASGSTKTGGKGKGDGQGDGRGDNGNEATGVAARSTVATGVVGSGSGGAEKEVACEVINDEEECPVCCEGFPTYWDDDKQSWMLKGGVRSKADGRAYHVGCSVPSGEADDEVVDGESVGGEEKVGSKGLCDDEAVSEGDKYGVEGSEDLGLEKKKNEAVFKEDEAQVSDVEKGKGPEAAGESCAVGEKRKAEEIRTVENEARDGVWVQPFETNVVGDEDVSRDSVAKEGGKPQIVIDAGTASFAGAGGSGMGLKEERGDAEPALKKARTPQDDASADATDSCSAKVEP